MEDGIFDVSYDIVVAGLGTAGAVALITAAKRGLRVLGIEAFNAMGGTGTLGAVNGYYLGAKGGIYETLNQREQLLQQGMYVKSSTPRWDTKAYALEQAAMEYGADVLYETRITDVFLDGNTVTGIRCFSNGKWLSVQSKMLIDCTGEAEICYMAGCATETGRSYDGQTQPFSNMAIVAKNNSVYSLNKDSGYIKQDNSKDLSEKIVRSTAFLLDMKEQNNDFKYLTGTSLPGIRQGRTIIGEECVTLEGFLNDKAIDNPIFYAFSNIDNHGKDTAFEDEVLLDWYVAAGLWGICVSVGIPPGALIPKGYQGILAAGRCLSVDHNIASCVRMKSDMEKCGEAAAEMACIAITDAVPVKDIDYSKLCRLLTETACLDESNNIGFTKSGDGKSTFTWITDLDEIVRGLKSDTPGIAIWSVRYLGSEDLAVLKSFLTDGESLLIKNTAIALGLIGDEQVCSILRRMASDRDCYIPKTSSKYSYMQGITAVYLLGKLRDMESADIFLDIICTDGNFDSAEYTPDELYATEDDVRFQYISYALASLGKIAECYPMLRDRIRPILRKKAAEGGFSISISLKANAYIEYDMEELLVSYVEKVFGI